MLAPLASRVVDWPLQMEVFPEIERRGGALIIKDPAAVATQVPMEWA